MTTELQTTSSDVITSRRLLDELTSDYGPRDFFVRYWNGETDEPAPGQASRFTLILEHPGALRSMFWPFDKLALGESYIYGDFEIEGDFHAFFALLRHLINRRFSPLTKLKLLRLMMALPKERRPRTGRQGVQLSGAVHSKGRDRQAISYHYDLPAAFYELWLDRLQMYTCGYHRKPDDDCDAAHAQKCEMICRKLRMKPGDRLLDIGCGWGGFIEYVATHYDVECVGITISREQAEFARQRWQKAGIADRCRLEICDYRDFKDAKGFDKVSTICVIEHFGVAKLPEYFRCVHRLLKPGGAFLNQHITMAAGHPVPKWRGFARKYVFPDGELQPISDTLRMAEYAGFEIRDVECWRDHYMKTLEQWFANLEARRAEIVALTDEVTFRIYRLYLAGSLSGFHTGLYKVYQTLQIKPSEGPSGLPLTRDDWYR